MRLFTDDATRARAVEQIDRAALVDVSDEVAIETEAGQLAQLRRKAARHVERNAELLVLLLAHPARAVVHGDADAARAGAVGAATVPDAAVEDENGAAPHHRRPGVVVAAEL